jgi:hypothetical protein
MGRSVVLRETPRCGRCQLAPRWCVCAALRTTQCAAQVDVLMHFMESYRPSSTGHLIKRVLPSSGQHVWRKERALAAAEVAVSGREMWILHPQGEAPPAGADPARVQVVLLDGSWVQANDMARAITGWGRRINLPLAGASRYWLRAQAGEGRHSTVEALLAALEHLGCRETAAVLRAQFELHVHASLLARGHKGKAAEYLATSTVAEEVRALLESIPPFRPPVES